MAIMSRETMASILGVPSNHTSVGPAIRLWLSGKVMFTRKKVLRSGFGLTRGQVVKLRKAWVASFGVKEDEGICATMAAMYAPKETK